jgi:hypothetical protein
MNDKAEQFKKLVEEQQERIRGYAATSSGMSPISKTFSRKS